MHTTCLQAGAGIYYYVRPPTSATDVSSPPPLHVILCDRKGYDRDACDRNGQRLTRGSSGDRHV